MMNIEEQGPMKSSEHVASSSSLGAGFKMALLAIVTGLVLAPAARAEHFRSALALTAEKNTADFKKQNSQTAEISGHLQSRGVGVFQAGSQPEEVVTVIVNGTYEGEPNRMTGHESQLLSFADGSTIKLGLLSQSQGKRFSSKIVSAEGTGRFQGIKITGSGTGNALDPSLGYEVFDGNFEVSN
jgi:hypothetical protein